MKNNEILLDVIGDADDALIPDLDTQPHRVHLTKWIAGGICAALIVGIGCGLMLFERHHTDEMMLQTPVTTAPSVAVSTAAQTTAETLVDTHFTEKKYVNGLEQLDTAIRTNGMGFEGISVYDISELDTPNPWQNAPSALPVYRNLGYIPDGSLRGNSRYFSEAQMQEIAEKYAAALHMEITESHLTKIGDMTSYNYSAEILQSPFTFSAKCSDRTGITVYGNGYADIRFSGKALPEKYHFTIFDSTQKQADDALSYLVKEYGELLGFRNPAGYSFIVRNDAGQAYRYYYLYEKSEDAAQDIANFTRTAVRLVPESGGLQSIRTAPDARASELIGDYPIITEAQAKEQLLNGGAQTTVSQEDLRGGTINAEDIVKTEIVYLENAYSQPFYKFYVELASGDPTLRLNGLRHLGVFYVPAVEPDYLEGEPVRISVQ